MALCIWSNADVEVVSADLASAGAHAIETLTTVLAKNKKAAREVAARIAAALAAVATLGAPAATDEDGPGARTATTVECLRVAVREADKYATELAKRQRTLGGVIQLRFHKATNKANLIKFAGRIKELTTQLATVAAAPLAPSSSAPVGTPFVPPVFPTDDPKFVETHVDDSAGNDDAADEMGDVVGPLAAQPHRAGAAAGVRGIDLVILMDATNSMRPWVAEVKSAIEGMIALVRDSKAVRERKKPLRVALVFYRDINDDTAPRDPWRFKVLPFSTKLAEIKRALDDVEVGGLGRDFPEDVEGALQEVLKLKWQSRTRLCVHVADAPGHGSHMHVEAVRDDFPAEGRRTEEHASALAKQGIDYYLVKLNVTMDVMAAKLQAAHAAGAVAPGALAMGGRRATCSVLQGVNAVNGASSFLRVVLSSVSASMRTDPAQYRHLLT